MNVTRKSLSLIFSILCIFALVACIPRTPPPPPPPPPGVAITLTVQAIQLDWYTQTAQALQAQPIIIVVTATPDPNNLAPTTDPAANTAPLATATSNAVTLTVSQSTNCRLGPAQAFDEVGSLGPGQIAEVIGKDTFDNYWIIKLPDGSGKTCWLWGQYATVSGDTSIVQEIVTPTPKGGSVTTAGGKPTAPKIFNTSLKCESAGSDYKYKIGLDWKDNSTNEDKFKIITDAGNFTAPANATHIDFEITLPGGTIEVKLKASNGAGDSGASTEKFSCP